MCTCFFVLGPQGDTWGGMTLLGMESLTAGGGPSVHQFTPLPGTPVCSALRGRATGQMAMGESPSSWVRAGEGPQERRVLRGGGVMSAGGGLWL